MWPFKKSDREKNLRIIISHLEKRYGRLSKENKNIFVHFSDSLLETISSIKDYREINYIIADEAERLIDEGVLPQDEDVVTGLFDGR